MEQITLNMIPKGITPMCHASQYDKGRHIRLNIMDGLQGYKLTDETAEIRVRKPDNNIVTAAGVYTAGTAYVDLFTTEQMTACEGDNECELRLTRGEQRIGSLNFKMRVEVDPLKDGIESETVIHNLEQEVADLVSEQYDADSVIFDDEPTEGHGTGYAVKSGGLKAYIPKAIGALDDVDIDSPAGNQALVWNPTTQKWENGEVSTVGSIDDLDDVDTTGKGTGDSLRFDPDAGEAGEWVAQETVVPIDEADYEDLQEKQPCTFYAIDDGSPLDYTAEDIIYEEGETATVWDKVESKIDLSKFITEIYSGTSAQATGDSVNLTKSVANFKLILIRFSSSANDMTYQLVHANEANTIFQTLSANGTDGQATYPLGFNTTMAYKLNGNKIDIIRLNYNQSAWKLKIVNVYGIIDVS